MTAVDRRSRVDVLGVPVDPLTVPELHEHLLRYVRTGARATVLNANVHAVNLAVTFPWFGDILRRADLVFCDGHGVMLGAWLLGQRLPERITYGDWMWQLAPWCVREGLSLYFLGSRPGVAEAAARQVIARVPGLRIAGTHHGYFDKRPGSDETLAVLRAINAARPDLLIVGFGMPIQEQWVEENRARLEVPVVLTAGAVFDLLSGELRRAPAWLGRLLIEPRRLAGRYLLGNPLFLARVLRERLRRR
jgi:N-acetylglucosaminyldiphosphoundecaprenol N-acetyl-beta-D-mannosaminyltransferase